MRRGRVVGAGQERVPGPAEAADADDARLLRRAAQGDHDVAMGELYDRYGRRV